METKLFPLIQWPAHKIIVIQVTGQARESPAGLCPQIKASLGAPFRDTRYP
jgi:hypothetical protein